MICSPSVEYLTRPLEVFREIARVLEPGGLCVVVFSHRWFPDQAVRDLTELHEFERVSLVTEYFPSERPLRGLVHTVGARLAPAHGRTGPLLSHDPAFRPRARGLGRAGLTACLAMINENGRSPVRLWPFFDDPADCRFGAIVFVNRLVKNSRITGCSKMVMTQGKR